MQCTLYYYDMQCTLYYYVLKLGCYTQIRTLGVLYGEGVVDCTPGTLKPQIKTITIRYTLFQS